MKENIEFVDLNILTQFNLSINELFAIIKIYQNGNLKFDDIGVDYNKLEERGYIQIIKSEDTEKYILRKNSVNLIAALISSKQLLKKTAKKKPKINVDLVTRIPEFRAKWKGLKPGSGSMGSLKSCKDKLTRWMNENPEYTFDDILKAADAYIESLNGDYRFLQRADYFIYKQENNREESSRLSAFIDEDSAASQDDWTTQLI